MSDDPTLETPPETPKPRATDMLEQYSKDALRLAEKLAEVQADNYTLREKNRGLRQQVTDLSSKVPADGALVLSADEAAHWQAYQALGTPEALQAAQEAAQTATARLTALERDAALAKAATAHGYKAAALAKLPSLAGQTVTIRDVTEGDQTVARAFVGEIPLPDYIAQHDAELLPALTERTQPAPVGTAYPRQPTGAPAGDLAATFIAQQEARRAQQSNPLRPKGT